MSFLNCSLKLCGVLSHAKSLTLGEMLMNCSHVDFDTPEEFLGYLHEGEMTIDFLDMDNGNMDAELWERLQTLNLYMAWSWEAGEDNGPGVDVWDPFKGKAQRLWLVNREPFMPIDRIHDAQFRDHYAHYAAVYKRMTHTPFLIGKTSHACMEMLDDMDAETKAFLAFGTP